MGMKNSVPKFWDWEWEWKTVLPSFGIGNRNEKQCSRPKLGKNWLKSLGKMLGTGIPAHARNRVYKSSLVPVHFDRLTFYVKYCIRFKLKSKGFEYIFTESV